MADRRTRTRSARRIVGLALSLALATSGCATLPTGGKIEPAFYGLRSLSAAAPGDPPRLLIIHGMTTQSVDYADGLVDSLAERLSLSFGDTKYADISYSVPGAVGFDGPAPQIVLRTWRLYADGQEKLRVSALDWSPLTASVKQRQFSQDDSVRRALINGEIKTKVVDDGIGDAALYLGAYRTVMRRGVTIGLCAFLEGDMSDDACRPTGRSRSDVALISMSLGSYMLFDAIERLNQSPGVSAAGEPLFERLRQFYMFANQLPLLDLADLQPAASGRPNLLALATGRTHFSDFLARVRSAHRLNRMRRNQLAVTTVGPTPAISAQEPLQIVAFSDPNDLLTYEIETADYLADGADPKAFQTTNVTPTVATPILGVFADPVTAHTGYQNDDAVLDLVVCGSAGCGK